MTNGAFNNLTNLTHLDLSYNKLVRLDTVSVEPLKSLQYLNISGNMQMDLIDIKDTFQVSFYLCNLFTKRNFFSLKYSIKLRTMFTLFDLLKFIDQ